MDITTIVFVWLSVLTVATILLGMLCVYLFRTGEDTRLEAMRLRSRINPLTEHGNRIRATARNHTIPPTKKAEIDLSQFEVINDFEGPS